MARTKMKSKSAPAPKVLKVTRPVSVYVTRLGSQFFKPGTYEIAPDPLNWSELSEPAQRQALTDLENGKCFALVAAKVEKRGAGTIA